MGFNSKHKSSEIEEILDSVGGKQDAIADLDEIRRGAASGATALQREQYLGTVTSVKINGSTKNPSGGVVDLGTVITAHQDISGKQDKLVSGTNIKTINGVSILGSGNIVISGGGSSGGGGKEFVENEPEFEPGGYNGSFGSTNPLEPNKVYVFSQPIKALYVDYINESGGIGDEYTIMFTAGEESPIIAITDYQVYWANGAIPSIASGDMCELSLVRIGNVMKATLGIFKAV